jgi:SAM-dependent methyltransferase
MAIPPKVQLSHDDLPPLVADARPFLKTPVPLCKVCDVAEYNDPEWMKAAAVLALPLDHRYLTKKYWEYAHLIYGLDRLDYLRSDVKVLSVGCGAEPPIFYMTNQVEVVVGIDIYGGELYGSQDEVLKNPEKYSWLPFQGERLKLLKMDGCKLGFADNSFDVVFSLSSIEHFGGHAAAAASMREMARVLKPGGCLVIATDLVLNPDQRLAEGFTLAELHQHVIKPSGLDLAEEIDLHISPSLDRYLIHDTDIKSPLFMKLHYGHPPNYIPFTSVMIFLLKK